ALLQAALEAASPPVSFSAGQRGPNGHQPLAPRLQALLEAALEAASRPVPCSARLRGPNGHRPLAPRLQALLEAALEAASLLVPFSVRLKGPQAHRAPAPRMQALLEAELAALRRAALEAPAPLLQALLQAALEAASLAWAPPRPLIHSALPRGVEGYQTPLKLEELIGERRPPKSDFLAIASVDGDTWGDARSVLEWSAAQGQRFDIVFIRETRFFDARQWCLGQALHLASGTPRRTGADRMAVSSGVALAIGSHMGENLDILAALAEVLGQFPDPYVVGADWNAAPEDLATLSLVDEVGGIIGQPGAPTCGESEYHVFVCSRALARSVEAAVAHAGTPAGSRVQAAEADSGACRAEQPADEWGWGRAELLQPLGNLEVACGRWVGLAEQHLIRVRGIE
ncbi:unnamed protein product, partial [Prorocentrum cordatum]